MRHLYTLTLSGIAALAIAGTALAQDMTHPAVKARKSVMSLYAFNLGQLGAMAKGEMEYDADAAKAAAGNLALLSQLNQSARWPEGTDSASAEGTRALPDIWSNFPDVASKAEDLAMAASLMEDAAGTDLAALPGAMGALGGACGACHKAYRQPDN